MEIKIDKNQMKDLLEDYYRKYEQTEGTIEIKATKEYEGYYEEEVCAIQVNYIREIEILGKKVSLTTYLTKEEVQEIFNILLRDNGYVIENMRYDKGRRPNDYGGKEEPYFDGVSFTVKSLNKKKVKVRGE